MKRIALVYVGLLAVMVAAMVDVTLRMLALERNEQRQALAAENERLALWRMESQLLPLILTESNRNYDHAGFLAADAHVPSPEVRCYFRCNAAGVVEILGPAGETSGPFVKSALAPSHLLPLQELIASDYRNPLFVATLAESALSPEPTAAGSEQNAALQAAVTFPLPDEPLQRAQQAARSQNEFLARNGNTMAVQSNFMNQQLRVGSFDFRAPKALNPMTAFWIEDHLYLARSREAGERAQAEGCLLDWKELKPALLESVRDLLPGADLVPLPPDEPGNHRTLAALPVRLIPGKPALHNLPASSALKPTLIVAWSCFLLSAAALGVMLFGVVRLSERRAAFVSAVTHELRTPLTTFRLYSDLLADRESLPGEKYDRYIETLKNEAERLEYLIENVLSWSRLEQSAQTQLIEDVDWFAFLERIEASLRDRASQAGMSLEFPADDAGHPIRFRGNRTATERILFNLIDNACKYAKAAEDRRITLDVAQDAESVRIRVRDRGPGISPEGRRRLFQPFSKSAAEAARSAPGIGLGLSLSRRLARDMRGELALEQSSREGTTFQLKLPRAT